MECEIHEEPNQHAGGGSERHRMLIGPVRQEPRDPAPKAPNAITSSSGLIDVTVTPGDKWDSRRWLSV